MNDIGYLIADNSRQMRRAFDDRVRELGVTGPQARLLLIMARDGGKNQGYYADILDVEAITLCRMVDRLEEAELVERRLDPADRRARQLHLTTRANGIVANLRDRVEPMIEDVLGGLKQDEREELKRLLMIIRDNLSVRNAAPEMANG